MNTRPSDNRLRQCVHNSRKFTSVAYVFWVKGHGPHLLLSLYGLLSLGKVNCWRSGWSRRQRRRLLATRGLCRVVPAVAPPLLAPLLWLLFGLVLLQLQGILAIRGHRDRVQGLRGRRMCRACNLLFAVSHVDLRIKHSSVGYTKYAFIRTYINTFMHDIRYVFSRPQKKASMNDTGYFLDFDFIACRYALFIWEGGHSQPTFLKRSPPLHWKYFIP